MQERSNFSNRIGFVLAAAGSAVGLGNIWRFPYLAAKYGGGIFLLVYVALVLTFGFSLMIAEIAIGRKTGLSAIGAYKALDRRFSFLGYLAALVPIIILPYYSVIGGWVLRYLAAFATSAAGTVMADSENFFNAFISSTGSPILFLAIFLIITFVIVLLGVKGGIEKANKFMMPLLVVLTVGVTIYSCTRPGAWEGVKYYFTPDFSKFSVTTVLAAMGQMFYSMSLAMGIMITYGSYMKKQDHLEKSVKQIEWFDTGIALLAGLMIVPAVFAFSGGDAAALNAGPGLMFVTLPKVFGSMALGNVVGILFFLLVLFAALTSAISLMETVVSIVQDKLHWGRTKSCILVFVLILLLALPSTLGYGAWDSVKIMGMAFLDFFDFISNSVLMPIVAFLTCILVGWFVGTKAVSDEVRLNDEFRREKLFHVMIKYVAPVLVLFILISSVLNSLGIIKI